MSHLILVDVIALTPQNPTFSLISGTHFAVLQDHSIPVYEYIFPLFIIHHILALYGQVWVHFEVKT